VKTSSENKTEKPEKKEKKEAPKLAKLPEFEDSQASDDKATKTEVPQSSEKSGSSEKSRLSEASKDKEKSEPSKKSDKQSATESKLSDDKTQKDNLPKNDVVAEDEPAKPVPIVGLPTLPENLPNVSAPEIKAPSFTVETEKLPTKETPKEKEATKETGKGPEEKTSGKATEEDSGEAFEIATPSRLPVLPELTDMTNIGAVSKSGSPELPVIPSGSGALNTQDSSPVAPNLPTALPELADISPTTTASGKENKVVAPEIKMPEVPVEKTTPPKAASEKVVAEEKTPKAKESSPPKESGSPQSVESQSVESQSAESLSIKFLESETELPIAVQGDLKKVAENLKKNPAKRLTITGYASSTDEVGSEARLVSLTRALEIRTFLVDNGIDKTRINVKAMGNKGAGSGSADRVDLQISGE
jgi:outer membrane protein OmpA-like peptidoglycan-associated protein